MLRLMSQNVWSCPINHPAWEAMGLDCSTPVRMKGHTRIYKELMPDIIGGQEFNKDMNLALKLNCIENNLPYTTIWGNYTPIIYRADKLELLDSEFLLFPISIDGYDGQCNDSLSKGCNLGVFRNKETGNIFIFTTTHMWWKSEEEQPGSDEFRRQQMVLAVDLLNRYQTKYNGCPVIFCGDMNTPLGKPAPDYAFNEGKFVHAHDIATDFSFHGTGYNGCCNEGPGQWQDGTCADAIDHILVRDVPKGSIKRFDRYCPDYYLYLSDHAPIYIDIDI